MRLLRLTCSPMEEFSLMAQNPPFFYYFCCLVLGSYLVATLLSPFIDQATNAQWADSMNSSQLLTASANLHAWKVLGLVVMPISLGIKSACLSALVWAFITLTGHEVPYKIVLTVVVAASITLVLEGITGVFVLSQRGFSAIGGTQDLAVSLGMDLLFPKSSPFVASMLGNLNPFEFWYTGLLGIGFWKAGRVPVFVSFGTAFLAWAATVLVEAEVQYLVTSLHGILA